MGAVLDAAFWADRKQQSPYTPAKSNSPSGTLLRKLREMQLRVCWISNLIMKARMA